MADLLFSPFQLGPTHLANRLVMAPMTRNRAGAGLAPEARNVLYYRQRASAGLIVTEATQVSPQGIGYPLTPGMYTPEQAAGWKQITDAVHSGGGKIFLQLFHVGRISHPSLQPEGAIPVAPSAVVPAGMAMTYQGPQPFVMPRALATAEIAGVVAEFRAAAARAREAGFDGVELHAANGYLLDQFLRDGTNRRSDAYGGPVENRSRLLLEVIRATGEEIGSERVGVRLSPGGTFNDMRDGNTRATFSAVVGALNAFPLAYVHIVEANESDLSHGGELVPVSFFRRIDRGVLMVNGGYDRTRAEAVLAGGDADLVAFGKLFIANPDLPHRLRHGAALNTPQPGSFYGGDETGYTDYPFAG